MPTPAYVALSTTTLSSATANITFSNIPNTYRDLVIVVRGSITDDDRFGAIQLNNTSSDYTTIWGASNSTTGTRAGAGTDWTYGFGQLVGEIHILDYAQNKHKTILSRAGIQALTYMNVARWANTQAVTSVRVWTSTTSFSPASSFTSGTTISLYGVVG